MGSSFPSGHQLEEGSMCKRNAKSTQVTVKLRRETWMFVEIN